MKAEFRFMNELFRIINGALRLDTDKVRNYTAFLAEKLEQAGDIASANHLRKLLTENENQLRPAFVSTTRAIPVDAETRFPLLEKIDTKSLKEPTLVLSQDDQDTINEFISIAKSYSQLESHGLADSLSLLLFGLPGTGKNRLARFIASELGLELYVARLDGLISSYLGSTAKNIRALFDFAAKNPCILFLDEFDAIAKLRGDSQEVGELKRVVNSFIQSLDTIGPQSIIIAATNHSELLDPAIWRRFNYRVQLHLPTTEMRLLMWQEFIAPIEISSKELEILADLSEGFSGSEIREICIRVKRRQILDKKDPSIKDVFHILKSSSIGHSNQERFLDKCIESNDQGLAVELRNRNEKLYSFSTIADLLGTSKATVHRWFK
jgi:SpoVK/Ycf46/Vps4 family AAA+-type ATPase